MTPAHGRFAQQAAIVIATSRRAHEEYQSSQVSPPMSAEPGIEVFGHEVVVDEMRIRGTDPVDFRILAGREPLRLVQAPVSGQQALSPQHLMNAGYAAGEPIASVEQRGIRIGDFCVEA